MAFENKPATPEQLRDALGRIESFVQRGVKNLLVIEDDAVAQQSIKELIGGGDVETVAVGTAEEAMNQLREKHYDCIVLDLGLPDMNGFELMQQIKSEIGDIPIIIYTGKDLSPKEETELRRLAETIIVKDVRSLERLLDETANDCSITRTASCIVRSRFFPNESGLCSKNFINRISRWRARKC